MNITHKSPLFAKPEYAVILGIIAFLIMNFWGLYSMPMNEQGKMADCPYTSNSTNLCQMSITAHIAQWRQLSTTIPIKSSLFFALALLTVLLIALFPVTLKIRDTLLTPRFHHYPYKHTPEIKLFDHLLVAFSQGILNPRIYA